MGLDMYFYGRRYLWNDREKADAINKLFPEICGADIEEVKAEFKYWRKFNALHHWFVQNLQDGEDNCKESYVTVDKLYELRDICSAIMDDPSQAENLLPTQSGFFFGNTDYDEYYFNEVKSTLDWLNDFLLKDTVQVLKDWRFFYRSSW
jgi:hypothetical protein